MMSDIHNESNIVKMIEYFYFDEKNKHFMAIVFEKLDKSLYDFIKMNNYRGILYFYSRISFGEYQINNKENFKRTFLYS